MITSHLYLFTRTPLHVGAGSSVGAIDRPIQRERPTGFPIIPGSSLKGVIRDLWIDSQEETVKALFGVADSSTEGSDDPGARAGAVQFGEARLLAFPVRSAKGCFAWITSPLVLRRFARDHGFEGSIPPVESDEVAYAANPEVVAVKDSLVLEEYCFEAKKLEAAELIDALAGLLPGEKVWQEVRNHLVVVSDGMLSHFATAACEVAQHVRIDDKTGTAAEGALFNQENVPSETLFHAPVYFHREFRKDGRKPEAIRELFEETFKKHPVIQVGADATTGLGFCSVNLR